MAFEFAARSDPYRNLVQDQGGTLQPIRVLAKRFGSYSGAFHSGYDRFVCCCESVKTGNDRFDRRRNLFENDATRTRSGCRSCGGGGCSSATNPASKRYGSFSGVFSCGYNRFLRIRYEASALDVQVTSEMFVETAMPILTHLR
jgi:hypothetical protein